MISDFQLISKMKKGDDDAFDSFVHRYYQDILTYCSYHCPDREYAKDLTQETFVRFFTKLSDYHYRDKTKNYLYTIARNLCADYFKKIKEVSIEEETLHGDGKQVKSHTGKIINKITVEQALEHLPYEIREVIMLHYFQDLKLKEIAEILDIGLPLVKYRLRQGKIQLEKILR